MNTRALYGALAGFIVACSGGTGDSPGDSRAGDPPPGDGASGDSFAGDTLGGDPVVGDPTGGDVSMGDASSGDGAGDVGMGDAGMPSPAPAPGGIRRLPALAYVASIGSILGSVAEAEAVPPPDAADPQLDALAAFDSALTPADVAQYEASARCITEALVYNDAIAALLPCTPTGPDDTACHRSTMAQWGTALYRRPMTTEELDAFEAFSQQSAEEIGSFEEGAALALRALLQAPDFLYVSELGAPGASGERLLTNYEMATRLSLFLLGTTPTPELLALAGAGLLDTAAEVRTAAQTVLSDPRAQDATERLFDQVYALRDVPNLSRDVTNFDDLAPLFRQEVLAVIENIVWTDDSDFRNVWVTEETFLNDELAGHYEATLPGSTELVAASFPAGQGRSGLLTSGAFATLNAYEDATSPTRRGRYVRERLLCETVDDHPAAVSTDSPVPKVGQTRRDAYEEATSDGACSGCHGPIDALGFNLEQFDWGGAHRNFDNGELIVTQATTSDLGTVEDAKALGEALRSSPEAWQCVVRHALRQATGFREGAPQQEYIDSLTTAWITSGYSFRSLLLEIVSSDAFRMVDDPK